MLQAAIDVRGISKQYVIGARERAETFREMITGVLTAPFRNLNRLRGTAAAEEKFWALKDVGFEVQPGEVVGIIGRNGAGKSTLLKILSRITEPTEGQVRIRGRVASLLEVGTGFHPELTGRENTYLNGAILGMSRGEIDRKFDEIVAFAEIDKFLDTPVKRYSSGMYVRLAFAVAAHLETDILLVDEVLAVGDTEFQQRCLTKMNDVSRSGKTVLFVSHNLGAISRLCSRAIWLDRGALIDDSPSHDTVNHYLKAHSAPTAERRWMRAAEQYGKVALRLVRVCQPDGIPATSVDITKPMQIEIEVDVATPMTECNVAYRIIASDGTVVLQSSDAFSATGGAKAEGIWRLRSGLPPYTLNAGVYTLTVTADIPNQEILFVEENVLAFTVQPTCPVMGRYSSDAWKGLIGPGLATWQSSYTAPSS